VWKKDEKLSTESVPKDKNGIGRKAENKKKWFLTVLFSKDGSKR
jgi:hypothetical protein